MYDAADFKVRDAASYDALASAFDLHTEKYSTYAVDALLNAARADRAKRIVDIGCGTGVVTLAAAGLQSLSGAEVVGLDLSDGMLDFARKKAASQKNIRDISFVRGDAEALDMPDSNADAVVSLYAYRHLPHPDKAAREAFRILKPGGRIAVAAGSGPSLLSASGLKAVCARPTQIISQARGTERAACGHLERLVETHLPAPKRREISAWSAVNSGFSASLTALIRDAGFSSVRRTWIGKEYTINSIGDFWDLQATFSSLARKRIAETDAASIADLKHAFEKDCR